METHLHVIEPLHKITLADANFMELKTRINAPHLLLYSSKPFDFADFKQVHTDSTLSHTSERAKGSGEVTFRALGDSKCSSLRTSSLQRIHSTFRRIHGNDKCNHLEDICGLHPMNSRIGADAPNFRMKLEIFDLGKAEGNLILVY
jgi:hypothetical protein